jgi:hypothetical protein
VRGGRVLPGRHAVAGVGWLLLLGLAVLWGHRLLPGDSLNVHAPPFQGHYRLTLRPLVPGLLVAVPAVMLLPAAARALGWRSLTLVAAASAAVWSLALAVWDGHRSVGGPLGRSHEYLPAVARVGDDPLGFLTGFSEAAAHRDLPVHVNGHPPLMLMVFWAWDRLGLGGPGWAAALVIAVGASAVAAVLVTVRAVGDEPAARRAMPFLVLAPFAVTVATSADAFFLGVGAWACAAFAVGLARRSWPLLAVAGLLAGLLPYLSYGLLPYGAVLVAVGWLGLRRHGWPTTRSRGWAVLPLLAGLAVAPVAFTAAGFSWFDGVAATHRAWLLGKGDDRPYLYSLVADVTVLGVLVGPATVVAATRRQPLVTAVLAAASAAALSMLALSGVTRLEVERIWLPFAPWLVLLTAALPGRARGWLAVNVACAIAFQILVRDVW